MKRILIILCLILIILLAIVIILFNIPSIYEKRERQNKIDWLIENKNNTSTEQHMQNLFENYQILDDSILFLDNNNMEQSLATLYEIDKNTNEKHVILHNVFHFIELNKKIFYLTYQEEKDDYFLMCYDRNKRKSNTILSTAKDDIERVWYISNDKIYYLTMSYQLVCYNVKSKKKEICMESYSPVSSPYKVFYYDSNFLVCGNGILELISLKDKKTKMILRGEGITNNSIVGFGNKVYVAINLYSYGGNYEEKKIESENNGLWQIDMDNFEKQKINSERYDALYLSNGILYDESFSEI